MKGRTKFAFCDRGDWRIQMYMPLMQELAERRHDVVIFPAAYPGMKLPKSLGPNMRVCVKIGVRPTVQSAVTKEYILVTDQDFTKRMVHRGAPLPKANPKVRQPWTAEELKRIYAVSKVQFSLPLIAFGHYTKGGTGKRPPYPVGSMLIGDYVVDHKWGDHYFKNWSFTKHAVSKITQAEARRRLGLPLDRRILTMFTEPRCTTKDQILAMQAVAHKYKKRGYLIVLRTKAQRMDIPGVDVYIRTMKSDRPMFVALEVCRASDAVYSYCYHGLSNVIRGTGVPYIMEPNPTMAGRHGGGGVACSALKWLILPGHIMPDEPLEAFKGRSLAPKLNHTYEQFIEKVRVWRKESGR